MKKLKGYTFYVDFGTDERFISKNTIRINPHKREWTRSKLQTTFIQFNCIAIINKVSKESLIQNGNYEGFCAIFYCKNSDVALSGVSLEYLKINCIRISQELTKKLHPKLIEYLNE